MAQIRIDIASEFKDKGFKKADKAATALDRQFKNLARTFVAVFSTRQIIAFGRASVKAFEQDELAARKLTQTLNNLNLGFEDPRVAKFISTVEAQTGVLDDELRPAMQSLLTTTASVAKSQELLNLAIEVSRGSGESLATVANDLSKAYVGNTRSLIKYNLGLTKSELQTKSFLELQTLLNKQFSGQSAAYLDTYAGKVGALNVAYANMQETIGKGLVDAFIELSGDRGIAGASKAMDDFATNVSYGIAGVVGYIQMLDRSISGIGLNPLIKWFIENQGPVQLLQQLLTTGKNLTNQEKPFKVPMTISGQTDLYTKQDKARAKAEKDRIKREKEIAAMQKKAEEERKKREKLALAQKRANTIFDMENIQIVAALQQKVDGETRLRLTALLALNTQNSLAAEKLADMVIRLQAPALANLDVFLKSGDTIDDLIVKLITSQAKLAGLQLLASDFPVPENVFAEWEDTLENIMKLLQEIAKLNAAGAQTSAGKVVKQNVSPTPFAIKEYRQFKSEADLLREQSQMPGVNEEKLLADIRALRERIANKTGITGGTITPSSYMGAGSGNINVNVNIGGNVTSEKDLVNTIAEQLYIVQKSGKRITYNSLGI